jgi:hypothetical protein
MPGMTEAGVIALWLIAICMLIAMLSDDVTF